jgi:hypothetical protein
MKLKHMKHSLKITTLLDFGKLAFVKIKSSKSSCNCSGFQKRYICKHILLQAIRFNYVQVPLTAQTVELEDMPKRGRPSTAQKRYKLIILNARRLAQKFQ